MPRSLHLDTFATTESSAPAAFAVTRATALAGDSAPNPFGEIAHVARGIDSGGNPEPLHLARVVPIDAVNRRTLLILGSLVFASCSAAVVRTSRVATPTSSREPARFEVTEPSPAGALAIDRMLRCDSHEPGVHERCVARASGWDFAAAPQSPVDVSRPSRPITPPDCEGPPSFCEGDRPQGPRMFAARVRASQRCWNNCVRCDPRDVSIVFTIRGYEDGTLESVRSEAIPSDAAADVIACIEHGLRQVRVDPPGERWRVTLHLRLVSP